MTSFAKHVIQDIALWAILILGFVFGNQYAESLAYFLFPAISIMSSIAGVALLAADKNKLSKDLIELAEKESSKGAYHRKYSEFSTVMEVIFMASLGLYFMATIWLLAAILWTAGKKSIVEKAELTTYN